ncbi:T6SS phospholipase effector Tle1-like catalytic domain-containing protein [Pseudomonas putida]|uniref:DUF2235 domain-containing protein n=1 Tax=Pseudomonas putida TaxID=303 RepID=A0A1Q9R5K6_PSEPU|nr:DUF2235 domain-containing protein [Pseudomonas putida]OLS62625.1 hypothetical protein PSEMO_23870 [Pseudomonas putida]
MSEINTSTVWYPPQFPLEGRLPTRPEHVHANLRVQREPEREYQNALSLAAGRRAPPPCCKTLHISLFFDGTGNNLNRDLYQVDVPSPTNVGRLFRASIGAGYAGGTSHSRQSGDLIDPPGTGDGQYFKYYIPGVGTAFPEVEDLDFSTPGLAGAAVGERRINWGLLMIIDALRLSLGLARLNDAHLLVAIRMMDTSWPFEKWSGSRRREREISRMLKDMIRPLRIAMAAQAGQSRLLGVRLYVYGFSRGAAAARAFVNWLNMLLEDVDNQPVLRVDDLALPIQVQYLGLLDTVASVGLADSFPGGDGHMSWADDTMELPRSKLVKRCLHIVASHEQRLSFPLDSIRREDGSYPENSVEVVHPGVHSDQGGGYPPGDQGKAISEFDSLLLSQISLHSLYSDAFSHGAPLKVSSTSLPDEFKNDSWRTMVAEGALEFYVTPTLIERFNAWREATLGLSSLPEPLSTEQLETYQPIPSDKTIEAVFRDQLGWITAWRIDRYAFRSMDEQRFYQEAWDTESNADVREKSEALRDQKQKEVEQRRQKQRERERQEGVLPGPLEPGVKDFDADMGKTQLSDAANEFSMIYRSEDLGTKPSEVALEALRHITVPVKLLLKDLDHIRAERKASKALGRQRVSRMFPPPSGGENHTCEKKRGEVWEYMNDDKPVGLLRALFDDQVHDSRAWFLYKHGREPFGSYFDERVIFFGGVHRRDLVQVSWDDPRLLAEGSSVEERPIVPVSPDGGMTPEQIAEAQKAIEADWQRYYAQLEEPNDAPA